MLANALFNFIEMQIAIYSYTYSIYYYRNKKNLIQKISLVNVPKIFLLILN